MTNLVDAEQTPPRAARRVKGIGRGRDDHPNATVSAQRHDQLALPISSPEGTNPDLDAARQPPYPIAGCYRPRTLAGRLIPCGNCGGCLARQARKART